MSAPLARHHSLLEALRQRGWTVRLASGPRQLLPAAVAARYHEVPSDVLQFLSVLESCCSPDETAWFLTADDYSRTSGPAFRWNECEIMSLDAADDDTALQAEIRSFWDGHFPVMLAVHSDYDYLAVRVCDGSIVHGFAPEWEIPAAVAPSFAAFLSALEAEAAVPAGRWPFAIFMGARART